MESPREYINNNVEEKGFEIKLENSINEEIKLKEYLFRELVETSALKDFEDSMRGFGYSEEEIETLHNELEKLGDGMQRVLSFPWELRNKFLPNFKKMIDEGKSSIPEMVKKVFEVGTKNGSKIAYHCSNIDITKNNKDNSWVVWGSEADHRDNDNKMAYYSFDYYNLYRTKSPKFLYLVSSHRNSLAHKTDGVSWGRAPSLDIIAKIDLRNMDAQLSERMNEYKKMAKQKAA